MGAAAMTGVVGSAIGAGSSLIGGAASTAAQNAANKEIAQMNNAFNEKMFDKQVAYNKEMYQQQLGDQWKFYNDSKQNAWDLVENHQQFQTDMWNKNNEYNSASAQRERLEAAGLNPYLMMNGGSAGTAQAMSGSAGAAPSGAAPSAQGVTPPTATPYSVDYSGISQGVGAAIDTIMQLKNSASERGVKDASAENLRIEGKYIAAKRVAELYKMYNDAKNDNERTAIQKYIASIDGDLKASQMSVNAENMNKIRMETQLLATENLMRNQELSFLPQAQKLQLAQGAADIALKYSQKQLTDKQARHEVEKLAETVARTQLTNQQYWTESANTVNAQLQNTRNQIENQFTSETYKTRVRLIEESLFDAIYNTDKIGIFKTGARFLQSLGVKP